MVMSVSLFQMRTSKHLINSIPERCAPYATRNTNNIFLLHKKHNFFKKSFFLSTIFEWNNLDPTFRTIRSFSTFKEKVLQFIQPSPNSVYNWYNPKGTKFIVRLRLGLRHLREHQFKKFFKFWSTPYVTVVATLNLQLISSSAVLFSSVKDAPSSTL